MALFNTSLFGGSLFAGALFGRRSNVDKGAGGPPVKKRQSPTYWCWTGKKFVYADTLDAIQEAIKESPQSPEIVVAKQKIKLPKPPRNPAMMDAYLVEAVKFADRKREEIKAKHEQDEIAVILATLGLIESDQLVIV